MLAAREGHAPNLGERIHQTVRIEAAQNRKRLIRESLRRRKVAGGERNLRQIQESPAGLAAITRRAGNRHRFLQ